MDNPIQPITPQARGNVSHSARTLIISVLVVTAVVGTIGYILGSSNQKATKPQQTTNTVSSPIGQLEQIYTHGYPSNSKEAYKIMITAPTAWRTTVKSTFDEKVVFNNSSDNLGQFQFVTSTSSNEMTAHGPFEPDSNIGFWDVTSWVQSSGPIQGSWEDEQIPASQKQAYMNYLINLRKTKQVDISKCPIIGEGDGTINCLGSISKQYIESADKVLSGYAGIELSHQAVVYEPIVYVYMSGVIDGKIIYAEGTFFIHDKLSQHLYNSTDEQAVMAAIEQIQKSLPEDTQALYQQILTSIKSVTIMKPQ